jgi:hypothetical protein
MHLKAAHEFKEVKGNTGFWILTDSDSVDHCGNLCYAPAHDKRTNTEMILERSADEDETADIQWDSNITCPGRIAIINRSILDYEFCAYHRRDSTSNTPLLRRMQNLMTQSLKYLPRSSPINTAT